MQTAILSRTEVLVVTDERYLDGRLEVNPSPSPTFLLKPATVRVFLWLRYIYIAKQYKKTLRYALRLY